MILGNGHLVIVDNDDEVRAQFGTYIQSFEGFTSTQRAIADDGDDVFVRAFDVAGLLKARGQADGCRGVSHFKVVVYRAFGR